MKLHKYPHVFLSTDNLLSLASLASGLAKYGIVSHLFSLLACPNLNPVDQISVLLTLGCCTQASGKSALQSDFMSSGFLVVFTVIQCYSTPSLKITAW